MNLGLEAIGDHDLQIGCSMQANAARRQEPFSKVSDGQEINPNIT
jgi:hypothetical protein